MLINNQNDLTNQKKNKFTKEKINEWKRDFHVRT